MRSNCNKACVDCGSTLSRPDATRCRACRSIKLPPPNPSGACMCGCGQPVPRAKHGKTKEGIVKGEYIKFLTGHHRRLAPVDYIIDESTGCWNWQLSLDRKGYGHTRLADGTAIGAHRLVYTIHRGPIPEGMALDHLCRNRRCVNPDHLEPVTIAENIRRGRMTKLTATNVEDIRWLYATGMYRQLDIARHFGVAPAYVSQIVNRLTWR